MFNPFVTNVGGLNNVGGTGTHIGNVGGSEPAPPVGTGGILLENDAGFIELENGSGVILLEN